MDSTLRFNGASYKVKNFMCFGAAPQGFEFIKPINIIIGKNNSGKTALIEMIEYGTGNKSAVPEAMYHEKEETEFHIRKKLNERELNAVFAGQHDVHLQMPHGGGYSGPICDLTGLYLNKEIAFIHNPKESDPKIDPIYGKEFENNFPIGRLEGLLHNIENPIKGKYVLRLVSERNILPESADSQFPYLKSNGEGATRILYELLNTEQHSRSTEATNFIGQINTITKPDLVFESITVKQNANRFWEVFLKETGKDAIKLSQLGSGLKTVVLSLLLLNVIPQIHPDVSKRSKADLLFVIEEIENFLHPALQRRLLAYIREYMLHHSSTVFITTHSNVAIDMFGVDPHAQILHVKSNGKESTVENAKTYIQHKDILDDLDVRASDILQSNGVIWVEGPSDRVYINHWINLWSDGALHEGTHYQIIFYGGRLLSHLTSATPEESESLINILRVNKNAAIVIDSDKRTTDSQINATKSRLVAEVSGINGVAWVTDGREIENYIPLTVLNKVFAKSEITEPDKFASFFDVLNNVETGLGDKFIHLKPMLAEKVIESYAKEDMAGALDLSRQIDLICAAIKRWNNM